jgi:DNA polymerase-3 subunit gamma/tau
MSTFVVSARKYRPSRFVDVVGQEHVTQTLKNALINDHLAHAFLFCGPRGVGKTTCARILAKVLNCQNLSEDAEPCNTCSSCQAFNDNASFNIMELDAASNNSVEHIRALIEQVRFQPQQGKYKVFIIDEVHMLSQQAFNAFLKTLEEPPSYAIFILATTEKHKIIPTILSRCQIFDFKRIQVPRMVKHLNAICKQEGIEVEKDALHIIAQKADGALRDALSIFDRVVSFSGKKITYQDVIDNLNVLDYDYYFKIVDAFMMEDVSKVMLIFDDILRKGFDPDIFISGLAEHVRNLLVCKDAATLQLLEVSDNLKSRYQTQANLAPASFLLTLLNLLNDCDIHYRMARNKRLHVEMALIKMTYINRAVKIAQGEELPEAASEKKKSEALNAKAGSGKEKSNSRTSERRKNFSNT